MTALLSRVAALLAVLACCGLLACSARPPAAPGVVHPVPSGPGYLAGVAEADITPPLHLSLFGHGPEGRIAAGVRLRLNCQVFVIALDPPPGSSGADVVALVPCDLQSPSLGLQRDVAAKLVELGVPITADRLFIMATHTHAAPGHYFEARRYSGAFSSQAPGYDHRVRDFLVGRIAAAVGEAYAKLAPACLGWKQDPLPGFTFNRSYVPFLANERRNRNAAPSVKDSSDVAELARHAEEMRQSVGSKGQDLTEEAAPSPALEVTGAEKAVDPTLSVLTVYRRKDATLVCNGSTLKGVLAVYGMHPTGVPNTNELYHGDIFGFAVRAAEGWLSPKAALHADDPALTDMETARQRESACPDGDRVIVGLANGVEGDVSPKILFQSVPEARKHGRALGRAIARSASDITELAATGSLTHLSWDLHFPGGQYDGNPRHLLCPHAELGMAAAGGARDGPTRIRVIPAANAGFQPNRLSDCHDQKVPLRSGSSSPYDFPTTGPIGLVRLGGKEGTAPLVLATVPGEVTTMTGQRIVEAVREHLPAPADLAIIGLTNQYFQYFATSEEYRFQNYEGASTLYGPHSEQFLVRHFGCLSAHLDGKKDSCGGPYAINVPAPLDASPSTEIGRWPDDEDANVLNLDALVPKRVQREGAIGWEMEIRALPLKFTAERSDFSVLVLAGKSGTSVLDDDRGASIEVREIDGEKWRVRWIPDLSPGDARCGKVFVLAVRGRVSLTSRSFRLECEAPTGGDDR